MRRDRETEPGSGDILLFYGGRRLGWWIERATDSPFYHVALYDCDGYVIDAVPQGVVRRRFDDGTTGTRFVIAPAPSGGEAALAWAKTQIGRRFDALGMLVVLTDLVLRRGKARYRPTGRFTCSHLVAEAYRQAGIDLVPGREPALAVPADFARLASAEDTARAWRESRGRHSEWNRR